MRANKFLMRIKRAPEAITPTKATTHSAAYDLYAPYPVVLTVGGPVTIDTGIIFEMPLQFGALLLPRSGLGSKHGVALANTVGLVDPDYVGNDFQRFSVKINLYLKSWAPKDEFIIQQGERFAQILFVPVANNFEFLEVDELSETDRKGGFGHSGK